MLGSSSESTTGSSSGSGSTPAPSGTPLPPERPYSLGGGSQGPGGGGGNNATNPNEGAGESFLKSQGISTGSSGSLPSEQGVPKTTTDKSRPRGKR